MLVFIDESGDAGFDLAAGASAVFALGMVIFREKSEADRAQASLRSAATRLQSGREFKFNKCSYKRRDEFFRIVVPMDFCVRAIVVQKQKIRSEKLRTEPESFYSFFLKSMLKFDNDALANAKIIIDGSGNAAFRKQLKKYLSTHTPPGSIKSIVMRDSHREPLLQLADMTVGAIARSYRADRVDAARWRRQIAGKIDDVWDFR